jgi:hypothetical protein
MLVMYWVYKFAIFSLNALVFEGIFKSKVSELYSLQNEHRVSKFRDILN